MPRKSSAASKASTTPRILQLKVTLLGPEPEVWRRLQVSSQTRLDQLHDIIQMAMGWDGSHMHQFEKDKVFYGSPDHDGFTEVRDEADTTVGSLLTRKKSHLTYEYDFGDSWTHDVRVEEVLSHEEGVTYPRCLAGERACPPEDCGGVGGYMSLLEALANPDDDESAECLEWVGEDFDPAKFDVAAVNKVLRRAKSLAAS